MVHKELRYTCHGFNMNPVTVQPALYTTVREDDDKRRWDRTPSFPRSLSPPKLPRLVVREMAVQRSASCSCGSTPTKARFVLAAGEGCARAGLGPVGATGRPPTPFRDHRTEPHAQLGGSHFVQDLETPSSPEFTPREKALNNLRSHPVDVK